MLLESPVQHLSDATGVAPEGARLVIGLFLCQLLALSHRYLLSRLLTEIPLRGVHLAMGLLIGYFVWGTSLFHHLTSAAGFYLLFSLLPWDLAAKLNFLYQLMYLVLGYYHNNMVRDYAINWTTSQSILTLKMIGLGLDLNDSAKLTPTRMPSILGVFGYTVFFGTYVVGPLDTYERFNSFMSGELLGKAQPPFRMALTRFCHGVFYMVLSVFCTDFFTTEFIFTAAFSSLLFPIRLLYVTAWGHCCLYKYLGVWCIAESTCMYMGYTYNGAGGWDGLRNVATASFHRATKLADIIKTWNINTSGWCARHIYKRCRFLGDRNLSALVTMVFLATWHGLHLGYYVCFLQEFLYMAMERGMASNRLFQQIGSQVPSSVLTALSWLYAKVFLSFSLVGFELYHYNTIMLVYKELYFVCPVVAVGVILLNVMLADKTVAEKSE